MLPPTIQFHPSFGSTHHSTIQTKVIARGDPRPWALSKHCSWVVQRRQLEAGKPEGFAEVVLMDGQGGLLEGLVTNFYVVEECGPEGPTGAGTAAARMAAARAAAAGPAAAAAAGTAGLETEEGDAVMAAAVGEASGGTSSETSSTALDMKRFVLRTTGPKQQALPGTMQRRVIQAAAALGMGVRLEAPQCSERAAWREAFMSNR